MSNDIVSYRGTKRLLKYYVKEVEIPEHTVRCVQDFLCNVANSIAKAMSIEFELENECREVQHLRTLKRLPKSHATDLLSRAKVVLSGSVENTGVEPTLPKRQSEYKCQ